MHGRTDEPKAICLRSITRYTHVKYTHVKYEGHNCYQSKDMANVKKFADKQTDGRTDAQTGQKLFAPDLSMRGHKKSFDHDQSLHNLVQT